MVNRVILCGILTSDVAESKTPKGTRIGLVKLRIFRYGEMSIKLEAKAWGRTIDYLIKKGFKAGMGVQLIGSVSSYETNTGTYTEIAVDTMSEVPWLTEAHKEKPWPVRGGSQNQAS